MDYSKYKNLAPSDSIENSDEYIEMLNWALQDKKIRNIALTGPYGSGKSSVIETFLACDNKQRKISKKSVLKISMATFATVASDNTENVTINGRINIDADEVEKGILKQLFYKVKPWRIPQSRYRKLHAISFPSAFLHLLGFFLLIGLFVSIFASNIYDKINADLGDFLTAIHLPEWCLPLFVIALLLLCSAVGAYLYFKVLSGLSVKEVKLPTDMTIQKGGFDEDSVFNKNLDEIMYFFEKTKYRIIIFEDLDRLDDPKIFVHLRELNNLLNNDDSIKSKPVVFIYAVRDDIFSREDRTKFFDFIIPVIPVINSTNSGEILIQWVEYSKKSTKKPEDNWKEINISREFIFDISPYISDMRILQNICNEFETYRKILLGDVGLSLSEEKLFAIITFKNLYPSDFADIQGERGIIKAAFEDKNRFISVEKERIQQKINDYEEKINSASNDTIKSVKELKFAMFGMLMGTTGTFKEFVTRGNNRQNSISATTILNDNYDMKKLLGKDSDEVVSFRYVGGSQPKNISIEDIEPYVKRWEAIYEVEKAGVQKLQQQIQALREKERKFSMVSFATILDEYSLMDVLSAEVRENELLVFLLRRGYIDENYANYINYFKGTSITNKDMNFILSIKNRSALPFNFELDKTATVVERLQDYEFEQREIYNFNLMEQLLSDAISNTKLNTVLNRLSDGQVDSWRFIDEFVDRPKYSDKFIGLLAEIWTKMWLHIYADKTISYDRQVFYLEKILRTSKSETVVKQNVDNCLACFFEQHDDILQKLTSCEPTVIMIVIEELSINFTTIKIEGVSPEILDFIFDKGYYELNETMIATVVSYKDASMLENLEKRPYSTVVELGYEPLIEYVTYNAESYIQEIILKHKKVSDKAGDIIALLKLVKNNRELSVHLIGHEDFCLESIEECAGDLIETEKEVWNPIWDALLLNGNVSNNWDNVIAYWKIYDINSTLTKFIELHADNLSKSDRGSVNDDFIKQFIMSDFDPVTERKLLPILKMENFDLDFSEISEKTLEIMVNCQYFSFTADTYASVADRSEKIRIEFIMNNQQEYMNLSDDISMSPYLFERLMLDDRFEKDYKETLFSAFAEDNMTEKIALSAQELVLPVTKEIFNSVWQYLKQEQRTRFLLKYFSVLSANELEEYFKEVGDDYSELADRTKRHKVILFATTENEALSRYLQEIGYITSFENVDDSALKKKNDGSVLKLWVKKTKTDIKNNTAPSRQKITK